MYDLPAPAPRRRPFLLGCLGQRKRQVVIRSVAYAADLLAALTVAGCAGDNLTPAAGDNLTPAAIRQSVKPTPERTTTKPSTDPRYDTCAEAKAAGYGPYTRGQDREYAWYVDRDGDGVVCE